MSQYMVSLIRPPPYISIIVVTSVSMAVTAPITLQFPMLLYYSLALQLRDSSAFAADLSQAARRLFRPFLGR